MDAGYRVNCFNKHIQHIVLMHTNNLLKKHDIEAEEAAAWPKDSTSMHASAAATKVFCCPCVIVLQCAKTSREWVEVWLHQAC